MAIIIMLSSIVVLSHFRGATCQPYTEFQGLDSEPHHKPEDLLRRDLLSWLQKPVGHHHFQGPIEILEEQGFEDRFFLDHALMKSQETCKHFQIKKLLSIEGLEFRPSILDEVYCINTADPKNSKCPVGNLMCDQRMEKVMISWSKKGTECWNDPMEYYKPTGCNCYLQF